MVLLSRYIGLGYEGVLNFASPYQNVNLIGFSEVDKNKQIPIVFLVVAPFYPISSFKYIKTSSAISIGHPQ